MCILKIPRQLSWACTLNADSCQVLRRCPPNVQTPDPQVQPRRQASERKGPPSRSALEQPAAAVAAAQEGAPGQPAAQRATATAAQGQAAASEPVAAEVPGSAGWHGHGGGASAGAKASKKAAVGAGGAAQGASIVQPAARKRRKKKTGSRKKRPRRKTAAASRGSPEQYPEPSATLFGADPLLRVVGGAPDSAESAA